MASSKSRNYNLSGNPLKTVWQAFERLDFGTKALFLSFLLVLLAIPFITSYYQTITGHAAVDCSQTLQTLVNNAASGSTLYVPACIYRESVTVSKPLTLIGQPGTEIRGSDVWTSWTGSGPWTSTQTVPSFYVPAQPCESSFPNCGVGEQAFIDGTLQTWVSSAPKAGQFSLDSSRHIILGTNPSGHMVEITTRQVWLQASSNNITVENFTMKHSAIGPQQGGFQVNGNYIIIENSTFSDAHGDDISIHGGTGNQVLNSDISRGGDLGVGEAGGTNIVISGNKIHDNNIAGYSRGWEAGGIKMGFGDTGMSFTNNEVYNNFGAGAWWDTKADNETITGNRVHDNKGPGIFYEVSDGAVIKNNYVWKNATTSDTQTVWGWGAGILSSSSCSDEIANNVSAWNGDQISIITQNRSDKPCDPTNINVHDNSIFGTDNFPDSSANYGLDWLQDWSSPMFNSGSNNKASNNGFWYSTSEGSTRYAWNGDYSSISSFANTPGGSGSHYLTSAQQTSILTSANMPLCPTCSAPTPTGGVTPTSGPTPTAGHTPTPTPFTQSPNDKVVTTVGPTIIDSSGNVWAITSGAQVTENGTVISYTSSVVEIAYVNGVVWQFTSAGNWYSFTSTGAIGTGPTTTSPLPTNTPTPTAVVKQSSPTPTEIQATPVPSPNYTVVTTVGPKITDSSGNVWAITSGAQVTENGTVISYTSSVVEIAYVNGVVWQFTSAGNWYSFTSTGAIGTGPTTTSPLPTPTPKPTSTPTPTKLPTPTFTPTPKPSPTPIPTPTASPTPVPLDTVLVFNVGLDGIGATGDNSNPSDSSGSNKNPLHKTRNLIVQVFDSGNTLVAQKTGSAVYNTTSGKFAGSIDFGNTFKTGVYIIKVKSDGYLNKQIAGIQSITQAQTNQLPVVNLTTGDINNDNSISILDYNIFVSCSVFSTDKSTCNSNSSFATFADLNDDGAVDQFDYNLFVREFSVQSGQ